MAGLLYRDVVLNKKNLMMIAAGELLLSLVIFFPLISENGAEDGILGAELAPFVSVLVFVMQFLVLIMMSSRIFELDESRRWAYFITSTPKTYKTQIGEKYLFNLLLNIALFSWCYLMSLLTAALGGTAEIMIAFLMMCLILFTNAIEFPFMVRFGSKAGSYVKTAVMAFLVVAAFEFILFGDISLFSDPEKLYELMRKLSELSGNSDLALVFIAALPYLTLEAYFISYKISCRLYLKGAESFER